MKNHIGNIVKSILEIGLIAGVVLLRAGRVTAQTFTLLHAFTPTNGVAGTNGDGIYPIAGVTLSGGTLYGATVWGGGSGNGTVFKINPEAPQQSTRL